MSIWDYRRLWLVVNLAGLAVLFYLFLHGRHLRQVEGVKTFLQRVKVADLQRTVKQQNDALTTLSAMLRDVQAHCRGGA